MSLIDVGMDVLAMAGLGFVVGHLTRRARVGLGKSFGLLLLAVAPLALFTRPGILRPTPPTNADSLAAMCSRPGMHTITGDTTRTVFTWNGRVDWDSYIVGMRPFRLTQHGDTLQLLYVGP